MGDQGIRVDWVVLVNVGKYWDLGSVVSDVQVDRVALGRGVGGVCLVCTFVDVVVKCQADTSGKAAMPVVEEELVKMPSLVNP